MRMKNSVSVLLCVTLLPMLGCQTRVAPLPSAMQDRVAPLIAHPEFKAASIAAPNFTDAALQTVIDLSAKLAEAGK